MKVNVGPIYRKSLLPPEWGFSLIESAIILGVVGLVIGGIWIAAAAINQRHRMNDFLQSVSLISEDIKTNFGINSSSLSAAEMYSYLVAKGLMQPNLPIMTNISRKEARLGSLASIEWMYYPPGTVGLTALEGLVMRIYNIDTTFCRQLLTYLAPYMLFDASTNVLPATTRQSTIEDKISNCENNISTRWYLSKVTGQR